MSDAKYVAVTLRKFALLNGTPSGPVTLQLSSHPALEESKTYVSARVDVECSDKVSLIALRLAALREVRTIIGNEIQRLERLRADSGE